MASMEDKFEPANKAAHESSPPEGTLPPSPEAVNQVRERGWLLPTLLRTDTLLTGRWDYLAACWDRAELLDAPIPRIEFLSTPEKSVWKMITTALDAIPNQRHGAWSGWAGSEYFRHFLAWLLHGFGHQGHPTEPKEPFGCEGANDRLAKLVDLVLWQNSPYDYFGDLLSENAYGKRQGFFPTPHPLAQMLVLMTIGMSEGDTRALSVMDPCVGTGRMLLHASNYSLRLYGQDIDPTLCLATLVNGYLFSPWLVRPLPYLDIVQYQPEHSALVSDSLVEQALPHQAEVLADTEHDTEEQWKFEPVKKRRRKDPEEGGETQQGILF